MTREEELEIKITQKIPLVNRSVKKIYAILTFEVGGISLLGLVIIVGAIAYSFQLFEQNLFQKLNYSPESKRVGPLHLKGDYVISLIPESSDGLKAGTLAANLVDGVMGTVAAPGSAQLDYLVDLGGLYEVHEIILYWGSYGADPNYIQKWILEGKDTTSADTPWREIESGGFPFSSRSVVKFNKIPLAQIRIRAEGSNYIGIYELSVIGKRVDN